MPNPLSDKAKGKQRAVEPIPIPPSTRQLVIRFTDGIPDSEIQCVSVERSDAWPTSIQVSEPMRWNTPTVESAECACMRGMEPYRDMGESARYSKTSVLYSRYGSE